MFAIEVEYLLGRSYAGSYQDRSRAEWPPHPARLYSAFVSAYHEVGLGDEARKALLWLESQAPPRIKAGTETARSRVTTYVPENYPLSHPVKEKRGKQPRFFPAAALEDPRVVFEWTDAQPDRPTRDALQKVMGYVAYLGQSRSLVRVAVCEAETASTHEPHADGKLSIRVPRSGRLELLEHLHQTKRYTPEATQERYRETRVRPNELPPSATSVWGDMIVLCRKTGPVAPIEAALTVAEATRNALMSHADAMGQMTDMLTGHGRHPHCAIVPLPFVDHEHADGRISGVAVVMPHDILAEDRRRVALVCSSLQEIKLSRDLDVWTVEVMEPDDVRQSLRPGNWKEASIWWTSATPIILDRFPKKGIPVEEILAQCCERIGLPRPIGIEHKPFPFVKGTLPVNRFRLQRAKEERPRWAVHARLKFAAPVAGPLLLGAGRFFGLGLMRPVERPAGREA